jgi:CMP-N-acetylneuraminic acid synthetase
MRLGVITAREHSKGVKNKNMYPCGGKPLIVHTFNAAKQSKMLDRIILSTDSEEIAALAREHNIEVPFMRPKELATDSAKSVQVLYHVLQNIRDADTIVLLQPTSPLRTAEDIDGAINVFISENVDSVVTVVPAYITPSASYSNIKEADGHSIVFFNDYEEQNRIVSLRQNKKVVYVRNGPAVLVTKKECIAEGNLYGNNTLGYVMPRERSIDINDLFDIKIANLLMGGALWPSCG